MYGFLVLLPLTIISVLIGTFILLSSQLADYVAFASELNTPERKTLWQHFLDNKPYWTRIASHLIAYAIVCFALTTTVRTVSNPLPATDPPRCASFRCCSRPSSWQFRPWFCSGSAAGPGGWIRAIPYWRSLLVFSASV